MLESTLIQSYDVTVEIISDNPKLHEYFQNSQMPIQQIPGFNITEQGNPSWKLIHRENETAQLQYDKEGKKIYLDGKFQIDTSYHDPTFLVLSALANEHETKGRIILHSSAVQIRNMNYLFAARRGGGKSLLATKLIQDQGAKLISGENTLIDESRILCGTDGISNRVGALNKNMPELLSDTPQYDKKDYDARISFNNYTSSKVPAKISKSSTILILDDEKFSASKPHISTSQFELLENSSIYSTGGPRAAMNFTRPFPNIDTRHTAQNRIDLINTLLDKGHETVRGNLEDVAKYFSEQVTRK